MKNFEDNITPYSKAMVYLLNNGVIESQHHLWPNILNYSDDIQHYMNQIGLQLILKEEESFAYLTQFETSENKTLGLITRSQMGFEVSVLLMTLLESLIKLENNPTLLAKDKFITESEILDELSLFLPQKYDYQKYQKNINAYIAKAVELGYLKAINDAHSEHTKYRIHPIIKEKITIDDLYNFKQELTDYVQSQSL